MNLVDYQTTIRIELSDTATFFSATEISRAVGKTENLLSRLMPKKTVVETTLVRAITGETLAIASSTGTLAYKPIKPGSVVITGETLDTDYRINYMTGVVTEVGSLLDDGDYTVAYDLDPQRLDISSLLSDYIRITRVEYPAGDEPPTYLGSYDIIDNFLIFHKDLSLTGNKHLRIYYDAKWTQATGAASGDYPTHLDDIIIVGAAGQCLIFKAEKYVQQAIAELELANAAADSMATPLAAIDTALNKAVETGSEGALLAVKDALDKVATYLETNGTTDNAKDVLANITDEIAALRAAISTAHDAANTYLDEVDTTDLALATYGAEALLKVPVDSTLINTITIGKDVARIYRELSGGWVSTAGARISAALAFVEEANSRLSTVRSYIEEAMGWMRIGEDFTAEAVQRLGIVNAYIDEATQRVAEVNAWAIQADRYLMTEREYLTIAGRYLASGQAKINEFFVMLGFKPELQLAFASAAQGW